MACNCSRIDRNCEKCKIENFYEIVLNSRQTELIIKPEKQINKSAEEMRIHIETITNQ